MTGDTVHPGSYAHLRLSSTDPAGTRAFYEEVFGWRFEPTGASDSLTWRAANGPHGTLVPRSQAGDLPPTLCALLVEDVGDHIGAVRVAGGQVLDSELDGLPDGRGAVFQAPGDVVQALWAPADASQAQAQLTEPPEQPAPGSVVHVEMHSTARPATQRFFERVFDWPFQELEETEYFVFTPPSRPDGGLFQREDGPFEPPATLVYLLAEDVRDALDRVRAAGGKVLGERYEIDGFGAFGIFEAPGGLVQAVWESLG